MDNKFSPSDNIALLIITINIVAFLSLPVVSLSLAKSTLLVITSFVFMFLTNLESKNLIRPNIGFNVFSLLGIIILICFLVSSFYYNFEYSLNTKALLKLSIYPIIIFLFFYLFPFSLFSNDTLFEKFLTIFIYFAAVNSVIAFIFMYIEYYPGLIFPGQTLGFFYHTNSFAFVFTFALPMVVYKYINKKMAVIPFVLLSLLLSACLLFTLSRAGYIGTLVGISIILFKKSKFLFVTVMILLLLIGSSMILNFATAKGDSSFGSRLQVAYVAYDMLFNNGTSKLFWGYGIIRNAEIFQDMVVYVFGPTRTEMGPHNFILSLAIQYGILLSIACTLFITLLLVRAIFISKKSVDAAFHQRINLSVAIVAGLVIQCLFEDFIIYPEFFAMPMFLIFAGYLYYSIFRDEVKLNASFKNSSKVQGSKY